MVDNIFAFLIRSFSEYKVHISDDFTQAVILNPSCDDNIIVYYYEYYDFTSFCACFSFQHCHLRDEEDVVEWVNEIINGKIFSIEFFKDEQCCFGGDINAEELTDLTYAKLEQYTGYYGLTKLLDIVDSFKVRGWERENNFNGAFVCEADGTISIKKTPTGIL